MECALFGSVTSRCTWPSSPGTRQREKLDAVPFAEPGHLGWHISVAQLTPEGAGVPMPQPAEGAVVAERVHARTRPTSSGGVRRRRRRPDARPFTRRTRPSSSRQASLAMRIHGEPTRRGSRRHTGPCHRACSGSAHRSFAVSAEGCRSGC